MATGVLESFEIGENLRVQIWSPNSPTIRLPTYILLTQKGHGIGLNYQVICMDRLMEAHFLRRENF